jgi:phthalate 4,5-dioxygenase
MVTESMGPITDHGFENLASSDLMIVMTRRRLLQAARAFAENGTLPPGAEGGSAYGRMRGGYFSAPETRGWPDVYHAQLAGVAAQHAGMAAE